MNIKTATTEALQKRLSYLIAVGREFTPKAAMHIKGQLKIHGVNHDT